MKSVVITGARGFLGSHMVRFYLQKGYRVFALTSSYSTRDFFSDLHKNLFYLDIKEELGNLISEIYGEVECFFHLAWAGVKPEQRKEYRLQLANLALCEKMIELASNIKAKKFIFPGSISEYLNTPGPDKLLGKPTPADAYGVAKVSARFLVETSCRQKNLPCNYVLLTSIYSAERDDNNVVNYVIKSLLARRRPKLSSCKQPWNFLEVSDAIKGLEAISSHGKPYEEYQLGGIENLPLIDFLRIIQNIIDPNLTLGLGELVSNQSRVDGTVILDKLHKDTGFLPEVKFTEGITKVIEKIKERS